jgi:hypothetical protein
MIQRNLRVMARPWPGLVTAYARGLIAPLFRAQLACAPCVRKEASLRQLRMNASLRLSDDNAGATAESVKLVIWI